MKKKCTICNVEKNVSEFRSKNDKRKSKPYLCSWCLTCEAEKSRASSRAYYHKNREKAKARSRAYHKANRFKVALLDARSVARKHGHLACNASVEELKAAFTGLCTICGVPEVELNRKLCMDHSHETGEFRGWICTSCNKGLGNFKDSEEILINALHYLMNPVNN